MSAIVVALVFAQATDLPRRIEPRDLYVSCSLFSAKLEIANPAAAPAGQDMASTTCGLLALSAIANQEGRRFCLPRSASTSRDPARALASAYVDFYDRNAPKLQEYDARLAYVAALQSKWPCPPK